MWLLASRTSSCLSASALPPGEQFPLLYTSTMICCPVMVHKPQSQLNADWNLWNYELNETFLLISCLHQVFCLGVMKLTNTPLERVAMEATLDFILPWEWSWSFQSWGVLPNVVSVAFDTIWPCTKIEHCSFVPFFSWNKMTSAFWISYTSLLAYDNEKVHLPVMKFEIKTTFSLWYKNML